MEHLAAFEAWSSAVERSFAEYINPALDYDTRATKGWPLTSLYAALLITMAYGALVLFGLLKQAVSKKEAEERKEKTDLVDVKGLFIKEPIRYLQVIYNAVQISLCGWMMLAAAFAAYQRSAPPVCGEFRPHAVDIASVEWVFYVSKVLDFMDTFFIVVRAKWSQFSFLHIYHHASIFLTYWALTVAGYDGDIYYTIIANSFIHFVMYLYYLCTVFGFSPSWGKNLTQLQMLQFLTMNAQAIYILAFDCPYPRRVTIFYLIYIISLFSLFMQFYLARWAQPKSSKPAGAEKAAPGSGHKGKKRE